MTDPSTPRLPPLPPAEWDDQARSLLPRYLRRPELYLSGAPDPTPMPNVLGLFAHHVPLGELWLRFGQVLAGDDARLAAQHHELAILRVAWRARSEYEWAQHSRLGRQAGLSTEQLQAISRIDAPGVWNPVERSVLAAADEMIDRYCITDDTWDILSAHFDAGQILELLFVIGGYLCLAAVFNSVGLEPDRSIDPAEPVVPLPPER